MTEAIKVAEKSAKSAKSAKPEKTITTKWYTANQNDSEAIFEYFYSHIKRTQSNNAILEGKRQQIFVAVDGVPRKEVLAILEWVMKNLQKWEAEETEGYDPNVPFDPAGVFYRWRYNRDQRVQTETEER